jgi:hypothetical protein
VRWRGLADKVLDIGERLLQVESWWSDWPEANIAAVTGRPSRIVVADVELEGLPYLTELERGNGQTATPRVRSQSGGLHLWFRYFTGARTCTWIENNTHVGDIRADLGLITLPPSRGAWGVYRFETSPADVAIASAPRWLHALIARREERQRYRLDGPVQAPDDSARTEPAWFVRLPNDMQFRLRYDYHLMDRSRFDAAVACEMARQGAADNAIVDVLLYPRRSKARERARTGGWHAAESYLAGTIGWARRKVEMRLRDATSTTAPGP